VPPGILSGHDPADAAGVQLAAVPGDLAEVEPDVADHVVGVVAHQDAQVGMRERDAGPWQCCDTMRRPDRVEQRLGLFPRCIPVQDVDLDAHSLNPYHAGRSLSHNGPLVTEITDQVPVALPSDR
jgi:hypothetical protein